VMPREERVREQNRRMKITVEDKHRGYEVMFMRQIHIYADKQGDMCLHPNSVM
jgi:hypothetical protein